ncbi:MAG: asparagine synthase-related protein, partial [Hyphococcus sp.]
VYKLPPAHTLTVTRGARPQLERYWKPAFAETRESSFHSASRLLLEKLDEAVATQMISDAPLGAFLSGGVDSAGVVTSMHAAGGKLVTCTVGFNADAADETEAALALATRLGADHHEHAIAVDAVTAIDAVAAAVGEPFADSSALPSYFIAREARSHVTVALTGDGGDEIFAGYRRYPFFLAEQKARRLAPAPLRSAVFGPAAALYPKLDWAPRPARLKTTLQALAADQAEGYAAALAMNWPTRAAAMASHDLRKELKDYNPSRLIADAMADADTDDDLSRAQYADLVTWLPGRILTKLDRTSMAHGLETRPPLLDHSLVEWAGRLPPTYKLQDGVRKRILKEALAPRLGWPHLNRPKQGFEAPLTSWLRKPKDNPVLRLNASRRWRDSGLFNEAVIDRMARDHQRGGADCAQELWTVIMFDAFLRVLSGQR